MTTKKDEEDREPPEAPRDSSVPGRARRIPRLESASEMRGYPISPTGTALGLAVPSPPASVAAQPRADAEEEPSPEEFAKIRRMLGQLGVPEPRLPGPDEPASPPPSEAPGSGDGSMRSLSSDVPTDLLHLEKDPPEAAPGIRGTRRHRVWLLGLAACLALIAVLVTLGRPSVPDPAPTPPIAAAPPQAIVPPVPDPIPIAPASTASAQTAVPPPATPRKKPRPEPAVPDAPVPLPDGPPPSHSIDRTPL